MLQYDPGEQSVHSVTDVFPISLLKVPGTHGAGTLEPVGQYEPEGQICADVVLVLPCASCEPAGQ